MNRVLDALAVAFVATWCTHYAEHIPWFWLFPLAAVGWYVGGVVADKVFDR